MKKIFKSKSSKKSASSSSLGATNNAENGGYDVKEKDLPKLHKAAWLGDVNKVKQLAKKAADYNQLDKENRTPLHLACSQGHKDVVAHLMSNKAKLNLCDNHNRSPLMKAVQADCEDIVVILLKHKADPNLVDKDSNTALHLASKAGSVSIAALLLDSGALSNASNKDGRSPLHLATNEKHDEVVELLLHRNADVNAVDNQNRTGLMLACLTDQIGMVRLFLDHKASTDIKDHKGWTANDHAIMGGYHGCSHLIDEYQASNRPRSRGTSRPGTGMFSSGTVDSDNFGYALGGPALDYGDDEDDEISADKMSNGEDSWAVSASETEEPAKQVLKQETEDSSQNDLNSEKAALPKLTKFMPESDTESVKSQGVGAKNVSRSGIPRAVSRESIKSVTSVKNDKQTSKIPRLASANPDHTPVTSKKATKDLKQHVPKSGFGYGPSSDQISPMSTPRGSMTSLGDSEWDDDDVLAALEGIPPQKDMRTPIAEEEEDDTVTPVPASKSKGGKLTESDKKMRKDVLSKLGMSDVDDDDDDEESEQFSEKAPSIEQRGSTLKKKAEVVSKATKNDTPRSVPNDMFDDDWDSGDDDMLPSHASDNKVHAPPATRKNDGGGTAQGTPDKMTGIQDDGEDDWDTDDEEEEESEWEKENRRQDGKGSLANRKDNEEDEEILRQEQWDKEMKEREERMKREAEEEIQQEKEEKERQQKENERFRKEEERKQLEKQKKEDELKEKAELERLQREERKLKKQRQEEQRIEEERQKEERRKDEERREKQRKEEERRVQEEKEEYRKQQEKIKRERERVLEEEELAKKRIHDLEKAAEIKRKEELEKQKQLEKEAEKKRVEEERKLMEIKSEFEKKQMEERKKLERMKREEEERLEAVRIAEEEKRISEEKKLEDMKKKLEHDHQMKEEERKEELRKLEIERQKLKEEKIRQENEWKKNEKERQAQAKKLEEEAKRRAEERKIEEEEKIQAEKKRQDEERQQLEKQKKMLEIEKEEIERRREDETRRLREEFERQQKEQKRQLEEEKLRLEEERLAMEKRLQEERENLKKVASGKMTEEKYLEQERSRVEEEKRRFEEQRMEFERKRIENMEKEDELRRAADDLRRNEEEKVKAEKKILEDERREFQRQKLELENLKRDRDSMGSRTGDRNLLQYQRSLEERLAYEDSGDFVNTGIKNRNITNNGAADGDDEFDEMLSQLEDEAEMMLKKQAHPSSTTALEQRPKMNHSKDSETKSAGNLLGGHMSEGAIPYKPANATFSLDTYSSMIIHPTVSSFKPAWKAVLDEHDGLSFTSSEGGDSMDDVADTVIQPPYFASTPLPQLNTSVNANTSHEGALRMHAALRDHKRIVEKERTGRVNAENQSKALQSENKELHRQKAELIRTKNELEQQLVELESKIRDLEFRLVQEVEKRHNSQIILEKTREQLARKEELYSVEIDARQKTELNSRNTILELRTVQNNIKQLEEECDELRKQLLQERNTRALQEEFSYDISKKHEFMKEEVQKTNFEKAEIINRLELADENRKTALSTNDKLKDELYLLKVEYERQKIKYKDSHGLLASENEELSHKIEQLKNDIHVNDEALAHATYTFNTQLAAVKAENVRLHSEIEKDRSEKGKLISELNSIGNRLETTSRELEKSQQARTELEKAMQRERDEAQQMRIKREQDLITSKDATQANAVRLGSAETRIISMENEIHVTQSTLMERNNQLMSLQRELDQRTNKLQMQDVLLQREKEEKLRLAAKFETATERLSEAQNDVADLKKSLEKAHSEKHLKDREATDVTDKLNETLHTLRADKDRAQVLLEEKNENLSQTISQLKNELQERNKTGSLKDQDAKALQQNLMDTTTKLSVAEAHLHHAVNTQEAIVREKNLLMKQLEQMEEKLILSGRDHDTLITKIEQLEDKLSQAERSKFEASEQLSTAKVAVQQKAELDDRLREVETKNARLEVMLKQESARCETLEKNLQEAHKMQTGMEAIVNNLNSANLHMEGKLTDEAAARSVFAKEAEEHKDMWETEVKSRSSLGIKMAQLQRSRAGIMEQVEEERRRTRKMAELKRVVEGKLENETQRYRQLEQEMNTTKMKLKLAKKKLKDLEMPELRINSIKSDFERERINMDATVASLRRQLEDVSQQLEQENKLRSELEVINRQLQRDASSVKIIGKGKEKLEKSKKRLEEELHVLKGALHQDFIEKGELERYKQELDAKARIEINEKLDQVNAYLEEQAQAREKLEQLRNSNEEDMRKELDNTITSQKAELVKLRSTYHDIQTQKDSAQAEAARFKELYERELKSKEKMSRDLENERDRSSNYESKLNFERQRNQHLKEASISPTSPILKRNPRNNTEIDSFTEKVWSELDKSISRHLRSASVEIGPNIGEARENLANGFDRSRSASARQQNNQYMDTLRRNYFV
ncbi:ankyrin repeat domain-containing protein 26-like isoform X3 [Anneissia japonica]|uniref:ankyrin repeat domain-containing protein 26-like isoform X3 n=1 Tax=Anneissia japonica TaxID=1529436 RepID=UPI0014255DBE|nr:ankyrin repeat domain-containing protein 26-like isoform X3 [Anneissia japonica]